LSKVRRRFHKKMLFFVVSENFFFM
jgi:hypothetical protein